MARPFEKPADCGRDRHLVSIADVEESQSLQSGEVMRRYFDGHEHATIPTPNTVRSTSVACSLSRLPSAQVRDHVT